MNKAERIEIQLSKTKLTLMLLGSLMFVGLGTWFVIGPPKVNVSILNNPTLIFSVGLLSILFFGFVVFFIFKKLFENSPGLIITDDGVYDNASSVCAGFVPWTDIVEIKEVKVFNQSFVNLVVKNPQDYIDRQKNIFKKKSVQINYNTYGTVIGISANGLKIKHKELKALLAERFADFLRKSA
jgi:hypothetical protein